VVPFTADWLHRALMNGASVHLAPFPRLMPRFEDPVLEEEMAAVRAHGLAWAERPARKWIRVRQPLSVLHAVIPGRTPPEVLEVLKDELNVRRRFVSWIPPRDS
jgi:isoleucyl-tRNA synthetase